ncbi:hypothetical protein KUTeg_021973 [Tegillarca granosa]|uniref:SH2 domain-containing protein n=1 Tax=Tegillarca granosa TaxID=220873 RepID=A0ABQ9E4W1_TEGGR|nr:hypothetical protein KUTeg_021973 [Tegillarca granosa]
MYLSVTGHLHGDEGWFPQHLVQEEQIRVTRKPSYLPVKLKTERNGTMSPPSAHHPATNNIGYVNVPDEESLNSYKCKLNCIENCLNVIMCQINCDVLIYRFVGPMDRDTAVRRLNNLSNGTFLIRVSENPGRRGELSLSIK